MQRILPGGDLAPLPAWLGRGGEGGEVWSHNTATAGSVSQAQGGEEGAASAALAEKEEKGRGRISLSASFFCHTSCQMSTMILESVVAHQADE